MPGPVHGFLSEGGIEEQVATNPESLFLFFRVSIIGGAREKERQDGETHIITQVNEYIRRSIERSVMIRVEIS